MKRLFYFLTILFFIGNPICAQTNDTSILNNSVQQIDTVSSSDKFEDEEYEEDFAPGLGLFALMTFIFICVFAGVGVVLALFVLSILFGLIVIGIISSSIFVGLSKQSISSGIKTFIISSCSVGGLILGVPTVLAFNKIMHWWSLSTALIIGSVSGLLSGVLFGLFLFFVIRKFVTLIKEKYDL